MQESSPRRPKSSQDHAKIFISVLAFAPRISLQKIFFQIRKKKIFGSGHQNGSPHIKSCSTYKKRQQNRAWGSHTKSDMWRYTRKVFMKKLWSCTQRQAKKSYVKKNHVWRNHAKSCTWKSIKIKFQDLPTKYTKIFVYVNKSWGGICRLLKNFIQSQGATCPEEYLNWTNFQ